MKKATIIACTLLAAGAVCCFAAVGMGAVNGSWKEGMSSLRAVRYQEKAADKALNEHMEISHLILDIDNAECVINADSDSCSLTGGKDVTWKLEGDTLTIQQKQRGGWWWRSRSAPITLNIQDVAIAYLDMDIDAGTVDISDLTVTQAVTCNVDAGAANLDNVNTNRLELDVDAGEITYSGRTLGPVKLECDAGAIDLDLQAGSSIGQVAGDIDAGEIEVKVNGTQVIKRDGLGGNTFSAQLPGAVGNELLTFDCDVGSISVDLTAKEQKSDTIDAKAEAS